MHDVAVAFDYHLLGHFNGSEFGHPTKIIATQVDQHDVLGAFLRIAKQILRESVVVGWIFSPGACPGDGANLYDPFTHAHVQFRRAADCGEIVAEIEIKHIRRRVAEAQTSIKVERIAGIRRFEALR